jgi:hypothetical protein
MRNSGLADFGAEAEITRQSIGGQFWKIHPKLLFSV